MCVCTDTVTCTTTFVSLYDGFGSPSQKPKAKMCGQLYFYKLGLDLREFTFSSYRAVVRWVVTRYAMTTEVCT